MKIQCFNIALSVVFICLFSPICADLVIILGLNRRNHQLTMASTDAEKRLCHVLSDLHNACRAADTEKMTERKKQIVKIKMELSRSQVISALNESSDISRSRQSILNWQRLFVMLRAIFLRDVKAVLLAKERQQSTFLKMQQEALQLLKTAVKTACRSTGVRLKPNHVVQLLIELLEDNSGCEMFGVEFTNVVMREMLSKRRFWCYLDRKISDDLLSQFCRIFNAASEIKFDRCVLSKALHIILLNIVDHRDLCCDNLFPMLTKYFAQSRKFNDSLLVVEHMLCATNIICHAAASSRRILVCKLGEELFLPLLSVWKKKPSDKMKDGLVEFFQLQMLVHYPRGSGHGSDLAYAVDWTSWKTNLLQLYEAVYYDLDEMRSRSKFSSSNSKDVSQYLLRDNLLQLAADLCYQLFRDGSVMAEFSQISQCGSSQHGNSAKRRRIETGWSVILDKIITCSSGLHVIPWVQLVIAILEKYPRSLSAEDHSSLVTAIQQLLTESKNIEICAWLLKCLVAIASCFIPSCSSSGNETLVQLETLWHKVQTSVRRFLSVRHVQNEAFQLFICLLEKKLFFPIDDIWSLFRPNVVTVSDRSVCFLTTYIGLYGVSSWYFIDAGKPESYIRLNLVDWLLPEVEENSDWTVCDQHIVGDVHSVANLVVALIVRDSRSIVEKARCRKFCDSKNRFLDPEWCFSVTSFDESLDVPTAGRHSRKLTEQPTDCSVLEHVAEHVVKLLKRDVAFYLENSQPEPKALELMAYQICLSTSILSKIQKVWTAIPEEAQNLVDQLQNLMRKFTDNLKTFVKKSGISAQLLVPVTMFQKMLSEASDDVGFNDSLSSLVKMIWPDALTELLFDQLSEMKVRSQALTTEEDLFNDDATSSSSTMSIDDSFEISPLQASGDLALDIDKNATDNVSPFSPILLSEKEKIQLQIVDLLCCLAPRVILSVDGNSNCFSGDELFVNRMISLFDEEKTRWSFKEPFHLQLLEHVVFALTSRIQTLPDIILESLIDSIRLVCKNCSSDPVACCTVVEMIGQLLPHMCNRAGDDSSDSLNQSRKMAATMHGLFWKRAAEGLYPEKTQLAIARVMVEFIKYDPDDKWSVWMLKDLNRNMRSELPTLFKDRFMSVRLFAASSATLYFKKCLNEKFVPYPNSIQGQVFEDIISNLHMLLDTQKCSGDPTVVRDRVLSAQTSVLHALNCISLTSEVCQKKALYELFLLMKERHFDIKLVRKMLTQTAASLAYESTRSYIENHLEYLLECWIENNFSVDDFQFQLLDFNSQAAFYQANYTLIVMYLMLNLKQDAIADVCELLDVDRRTAVESCLPLLLVHILPSLAVSELSPNGFSTADGSFLKRLPVAKQCYNAAVNELTEEVVKRSMLENLEAVVVGILLSLNDATDNERVTDASNQHLGPAASCVYAEVVMATLDYITKSCGADTGSIVSLLAQRQDGIQRILLLLSLHLSKVHSTVAKHRILLAYQLFVHILLKDFPKLLGNSQAYIMRDIVYKPLHFIYDQISSGSEACDDEKCDVLFICCDILSKILETMLPLCHQELALYISVIISNIIPLVDLREDLKAKCEEIVDCIFIRNADRLQVAILKMDPLPEKPSFQNARKVYNLLKCNASSGINSTLEEIDLFLRVNRFNRTVVSFRGSNSRPEALLRLNIQLSGGCHKLKLLLADPSQEPRVSQLLYQLVEDLLKLVNSSDYVGSADFEMELAKCIGTLGMMNLQCNGPVNGINTVDSSSSEVLSDILSRFPNDVQMQQYCQIFHALNSYLVDSDVALVSATCDVLKNVLSTKAGKQFVSVYKSRLPDDRLFLYLRPFLSSSHREQQIVLSDKPNEFAALVDNDVLWNSSQISHRNWIQGLLSALLNSGCVQDEVLKWLDPVCQVQTDFCELVLPFVFHNILLSDTGEMKCRKILSEQVSSLLKQICRSRTPPPSSRSSRKDGQLKNTESVRTLLNVVQYLRLQEKSKNDTLWSSNFWLDVNYHYLAKAALICSASYTSLLYSEIAQLQNGRYSAYDLESCGDPNSAVAPGNIDIQDVLLEAYRSISDSDSIYGCAINKRHTDHSARTKMYEHEGNWMKALTSHDLSINQSSDQSSLASHAGLLKSLQNLGCDHLLDVYLKGLLETQRERRSDRICGESSLVSLCGGMREEERESRFRLSTEADIQEIQYQAAYRSCRWDLEIPNKLDGQLNDYNQLIYSCMVGLKQKDRFLVAEGVAATRQLLLESLSSRTREENDSNVFPALYKLRSISEIEGFADALILRSDNALEEILTRWSGEQSVHKQEYEHIEPLLMQRCTMLQLARSDRPKCEKLHNALTKSLQMVATAAREAGRYQASEIALLKLSALSNEDDAPAAYGWRIEKAKLFWAKGEEDSAKYLLKDLIKELASDANSASQLYGHCLVMYGNWLAKARSKSPSVILERYIEKGTKLLEESGSCNEETVVDAFLSFARYADAQHQVIVDYMKSYTFGAKQSLIRQAEDDMGHMKRMGEAASRYYRTLEKQRQIDEEELKRLVSDREQFLMYALQNYIKCLQNHDCHDRYIYRLVSLWFDNMKSGSVNQIIKDGIIRIKSHKFISLMYQLAARMCYKTDDEAGEFNATLTQLIESVVADHPHHCLSIIFSLANAKRDSEVPRARSRGRSSTAGGSQDSEMEEDRVMAAKKMLTRLQKKKKGNRIDRIVTDMDRLCSAYIQLANWNVDRYKGETKPINLPDSLAITQIRNLENVAVMTINAPVDPTCEYKDVISMIGFQSTFTLAGGINLPKIISCKGSDGVLRRQLVKGRDDLRQDAVMQQVFMMVNNLLEKNLETRKRRLNVRTYKVVPLSQRSGILEWCEGTLPMGEYLIGSSNGAHQRYRPLDWKAMDCRKQLTRVHAEGSDRAKYDVYQEICKKFQPVFHNFFMEHYRHPVEWYHKRLSYTRSVATNSIVGYILGLGDRHIQNILIDTQTAELIHIDLGVAFEQGRILPTPETVPFRLTRDIVDGMGVTGVEGVFRRCCEKTMEVMHSSEEVIITILQVLLYDPLYSWTMSTVKACQLQSNKTIDICPGDVLDASGVDDRKKGDHQDNVNKVAKRVLLRLKQKLHGMENDVQLSISGQVNHLIQEATDPKNLCRLFPGWQAYI